jgi:hypothetical protein
MAREINAAIHKEVFPILRDVGRYLKVTLIDGEEEINNYRKGIVNGGLSQEEKDNGSAVDTMDGSRPAMKSELFANDNYNTIAAQITSAQASRPTVNKYGSIKDLIEQPKGNSKRDNMRSIFY